MPREATETSNIVQISPKPITHQEIVNTVAVLNHVLDDGFESAGDYADKLEIQQLTTEKLKKYIRML